jgi:nucleoside-diphosphate-sugar epimerase
MNVLITGGMGSLGSRLAVPLVDRGDSVAALDIRATPHFHSSQFQQVQPIVADLSDRDAMLQAVRSVKADTIFHLGAVLSSSAEDNPSDAWLANMNGTLAVLEAARQSGAKRVIFASTIATYGPGGPATLLEDSPQWPVSLYGVTKVAGERLGAYYESRFGLDFSGVRLPAVIAARGSRGGASAYCSAVFEESVLHGHYDFYVNPTTTAPMVYIDDAVKALLDLHDSPKKKRTRNLYNIAAIFPSAAELAGAVKRRLPEVEFTYHPDRLRTAIVESWPRAIDDADARRDWGWRASWDLEHMTDAVIEALQNEPAG